MNDDAKIKFTFIDVESTFSFAISSLKRSSLSQLTVHFHLADGHEGAASKTRFC